MEESSYFITVKESLDYSTKITIWMTNFATSLPFTIYFLGFINYFTMSSLYVLLNFELPEILYRYLAFSYQQINEDVLRIFGFQLTELNPLSDERVTSKRGLFFGISSDFVPTHLWTFVFMIGNIGFILSLQLLTACLRKNNFFRKLVRR